MNTKQVLYAIELSKSLNFSQVAEQLGISQPALSKQILNLENELGVKLFDRRTSPLTLTPAGEYFIREAQELVYQEDQLMRSLQDYKRGERGKLTIGISPFRCLYYVADVLKRFRERYPDVQVTLHEAGSDLLRQEATEGKFDFAIVNLPVDESVLDVTPLEPDTMVLAVPKTLLDKLPAHATESEMPSLELQECAQLPFIVVGQSQEMRQLFERSCVSAKFHPHVVMEVVGVATAWTMARAGIGATLLPLQFANSFGATDEVVLFSLKHHLRSRQPAIITRRGQYVSDYAQYAIRLFTEQTAELE